MQYTGILGSAASSLGNLLLGGAIGQADLVAGTPGLLLFYDCDDRDVATQIREKFGHNATATPHPVALGIYGVEGTTLWTPSAPLAIAPPPYNKQSSYHTYIEAGGADVTIGDSGSIEFWFRPDEFGDMFRFSIGDVTPTLATEYEIARLESPGRGFIQLTTAQDYLTGEYRLWVEFSTVIGNLDPNAQTAVLLHHDRAWFPFLPPLQPGRWYYIGVAWDQTGTNCYCDDHFTVSVADHPPAAFGNATFRFGASGGQYDLVAVTNRSVPHTEIKIRSNPAIPMVAPYTQAWVGSVFASYAATYPSANRVTKLVAEVLRTGERDTRVTDFKIEVLRSTEPTDYTAPSVTEDLPFTQTVTTTVTGPAIRDATATDTLTFTETASATARTPVTRTAAVTQTLGFTQDARRAIVQSAGQTVVFVETAAGYHTRPTGDTLAFTESVTTSFIRDRELLQVFDFSESTVHDGIFSNGASETLVFTETYSLGHSIEKALLQQLDFSGVATATVIHTDHGSAAETLVFTETTQGYRGKLGAAQDRLLIVDGVVLKRTFHRSVSDTLVFTETATRGAAIFSRSVSDTLVFDDPGIPTQLPIVIDGRPVYVTIPVARIVKVAKTVILTSLWGAVVLPPPEFGDTDALNDSVTVKRTMTGIFYTYVKTQPTRTLNYEFTLTRATALKLREFLANSLSIPIWLTNWKGESYVGFVLNNPVSFTRAGRYAGSYEKVTVTLNYEGVCLS